jgi:hypothetical protein
MRAWIRDNVPIAVASLVLGAVLLLMAGSRYGFDRLYCWRPSHPSTWDNPPVFAEAKDLVVKHVDSIEQEKGLLQKDDGRILLHRVITYKVDKKHDDEMRTFLASALRKDCWSFGYDSVPGVQGVDTGDYRRVWHETYYFDMVIRWPDSSDVEVEIHTRRAIGDDELEGYAQP